MAQTEFIVDKDALEVRTVRTFNAERQKLWQAVTSPEFIPQWWGPRGLTTRVDKHDFRVGGEWRFVHTDAQGQEYGFHGVFKEIDEPYKVADTFEFEPMPGHVLLETMTLEEVEPGRTKMTAIAKYATIEDLEGMVASGMETGQRESYDRLAELLEP